MKSPRFWLIVWGTIGSVFLVYVILAASVKPNKSPSKTYLTGEMADFDLAFPPRRAAAIPFAHKDQEITLESFRGKTVLVNFWATWCAPCLKELPSLDRLQQKMQGSPFEVVAIAADPRGPIVAQRHLEKLDIRVLKLYTDPRLLFASAIGGANVLPVSILYDAKGNEIGRLVGEANWDSSEAILLVQAIMNGDKVTK